MRSLLKEYVEHNKYGRGLIVAESEGKITVAFSRLIGNKLFQFPEAFEQFLKMEDQTLSEECLKLVQERKQQIVEERERIRLELLRVEEETKREALELSKNKKRRVTSGRKVTKQKAV